MENETTRAPDPVPPEPSFLEVVQRTARLVVAMTSTRLALIGADVAEAQHRIIRGVVLALASAMLGFLAITFISVAVLVYFWDTHRIVAAVAIPLIYLAGAAVAFFAAASAVRAAPRAFATTFATLRADRDSLLHVGEAGHARVEP